MGFDQLAFSFAHLGLLIYIHCQPNGFGSQFSQWARASAQLQLWWWVIFSPLVSSPVGGTVYANVIWPGMKWKYAPLPHPFPFFLTLLSGPLFSLPSLIFTPLSFSSSSSSSSSSSHQSGRQFACRQSSQRALDCLSPVFAINPFHAKSVSSILSVESESMHNLNSRETLQN